MLQGPIYAGRRMTMWPTREDAVRSFDKSDDELLERSEIVWWRNATVVEVIHPTPEQLKKDLLRRA